MLLTIGLVAVLFVVYQLVVTDLVNDRRQDALSEDLRDEWNAGRAWTPPARGRPAAAGEVPIGSSFAVLYIPQLGSDYRRVSAKALLSLLLVLTTIGVLLLVVFSWVELRLPASSVTVGL